MSILCVQGEDVDKAAEPNGNVHAEIIREFFSNAIVEEDRIGCWLRRREFYITRKSTQEILEIRPTTPHTSLQYDERREKLGPIVDILGGEINKKALLTIPFTLEMRTLAYIMIFNLYPVKNLTNLSTSQAIFLLDLYTHKGIDICRHICHLFTKCITKRNTRLILPFPSIIMALITRARVKIPSGLPVMPRDYPIGAQTMTQSKAHIPGPFVGVSQIPRDNVDEEEGGDTEEEIDHFTSALEDTTQPSS
ncbi:hypothetical protein SO802_005934 [Lithocarpus litseifolius]|uniref:Putative plant transposon protein domain-containing protein n=1 Tax=Lithocarpus litseifolius TaxID=425828 RepID=A0AAW2DK84_9ROSI